jgi:hypothetical protein
MKCLGTVGANAKEVGGADRRITDAIAWLRNNNIVALDTSLRRLPWIDIVSNSTTRTDY